MEILTNKIELAGVLAGDAVLSHSVFDEKFYSASLEIHRLSEKSDLIPITIHEKIFAQSALHAGDRIHFEGQLRSYNYYMKIDDLGENKKSRLVVTAFCKNLLPYSEDINSITLEGYICKTPVYRVTPFGKQITDVLVAVNRNYGKSDYIPVIFWGENARLASRLDVGKKIFVSGRLQSRNYEKRDTFGIAQIKTTYEVSGFQIKY